MGTWFEGVLLDVEAVGGGPTPRVRVLRKRGISTRGELNTFNSVFKKHWKTKAPDTGNALDRRDLLAAKLRHIQLTPWPSQAKGKVSVGCSRRRREAADGLVLRFVPYLEEQKGRASTTTKTTTRVINHNTYGGRSPLLLPFLATSRGDVKKLTVDLEALTDHSRR